MESTIRIWFGARVFVAQRKPASAHGAKRLRRRLHTLVCRLNPAGSKILGVPLDEPVLGIKPVIPTVRYGDPLRLPRSVDAAIAGEPDLSLLVEAEGVLSSHRHPQAARWVRVCRGRRAPPA